MRCSEPLAWQQDDAAFLGQPKQYLERVLVAQQPLDEVATVAPNAEDFEVENCIIVDRIRIVRRVEAELAIQSPVATADHALDRLFIGVRRVGQGKEREHRYLHLLRRRQPGVWFSATLRLSATKRSMNFNARGSTASEW